MAELFDWLFNSVEADTVAGLTLIFGIGALLYAGNWWILLYNNIPKLNPEGRFVSMAGPLGGLLLAVGILLTGGGWWALIGLTDPFIGSLIYVLLREFVFHKNRKVTDENGGKNDSSDEHQ